MSGISRLGIFFGVTLAAILAGSLVYLMPERARELKPSPAAVRRAAPAMPAYAGELHERFQQAAVMLHAGQPQHALTALDRVLALAPNLPEARVNAGFALYQLAELNGARAQFHKALELRPGQANAYYGLAMTLEALGDLDGALGAMRTYVHLADRQDAHVRRAQSAIWEWQSMREQGLAAGSDSVGANDDQQSEKNPGKGG